MSYANPIYPAVYTVTIAGGSTVDDNQIVFPGTAVYIQITNESDSQDLMLQLNSLTDLMTLPKNTTQIFNHGDMQLQAISFDNTPSGSSDVDVQIVVGYTK